MRKDYAGGYRELYERHWWWRSREAFLLDEIRVLHRRRPRRRILDVGCGDGLFFDKLSRFGEVDGLEADPEVVENSRHRSRIEVGALGPGYEARRRYDLVLMLDVLEHIDDDRAALEAARSSLDPGGRLLLTVPALPALWSRHDEANEHRRRYLKGGLVSLLKEAGFAVESIRHAFFWTVAPLLARRFVAPAGRGDGIYSVSIPPKPINAFLDGLSRVDHALGRFVRWPVGGSLVAVAGPAARRAASRDPVRRTERQEERCGLSA